MRVAVPLTKGNGRRRFGGHTYRISGAVMAFHAGAEDQEVCDLGGWSSIDTMKKYLRGAHSLRLPESPRGLQMPWTQMKVGSVLLGKPP